jgi:hypothetical protein
MKDVICTNCGIGFKGEEWMTLCGACKEIAEDVLNQSHYYKMKKFSEDSDRLRAEWYDDRLRKLFSGEE